MVDLEFSVCFWKTNSRSKFLGEFATEFSENYINNREVESSITTVKELLLEHIRVRNIQDVFFNVSRQVISIEDQGNFNFSSINLKGDGASPRLIKELRKVAKESTNILYRKDNLDFKFEENETSSLEKSVIDLIKEKLQENQHRSLKGNFNFSTDPEKLDHEVISGFSEVEIEKTEFESKDVSGVGKVLGFDQQKSFVLIKPVINNQLMHSTLTFFFKEAEVDLIYLACRSRVEGKLLKYFAKTNKNPNGKIFNYVTAAEISEIEDAKDFELASQ